MKLWLNVTEGAECASVCRDTIYTACEQHELRHVHVSGRRAIRLRPQWIDAWLERHVVDARDPHVVNPCTGNSGCGVEGHVMKARLTRGAGITRADHGLDNPHESRRAALPVLLTVDEAADLLRSREAATVCPAFGLERTGGNAKGWTAALRAAHATAHRGARRASAPEEQTSVLSGRSHAVHAADRARSDATGGAPGERQARGTHPPPHVLLTPLDARGAAKGDPELAGHTDLTMTQRCMHPSPAALDAAISLLERPSGDQDCGDILATAGPLPKRSKNPGG